MKLLSLKTRIRYDDDHDTSYLEQKGFEKRREAYQNEEFTYVGIDAVAEVEDSNNVIQRVHSGGTYNVESDNYDNIEEIKAEELDELLDTLRRDYHITQKEIKDTEIEEDDNI